MPSHAARILLPLAASALLLHCAGRPPDPVCSPAAESSIAQALAAQGSYFERSVPVPVSHSDCSAAPSGASARVIDPRGEPVEASVSFETDRAKVSFTPAQAGWYDVRVDFGPEWGAVKAPLFVYAPHLRDVQPEQLMFRALESCTDLQLTSSGIWLCDDQVVGMGPPVRLGGRTVVAGDSVWVQDENTLRRYDASSGELVLRDSLHSLIPFKGLLHASGAEVWVKSSGVQRLRVDANGIFTELLNVPDSDAERVLVEGDTALLLANNAPKSATQPREFTACELSLSQANPTPTCHNFPGVLFGGDARALLSYEAHAQKLLQFTINAGRLTLRDTLQLPSVMHPIAEPKPGLSTTPLFSDGVMLLLPKQTESDELSLEQESAADVLRGANPQFLWSQGGVVVDGATEIPFLQVVHR